MGGGRNMDRNMGGNQVMYSNLTQDWNFQKSCFHSQFHIMINFQVCSIATRKLQCSKGNIRLEATVKNNVGEKDTPRSNLQSYTLF